VCGCETWPVSLGEESRPRVFENGIMKKVFGSEKEELETVKSSIMRKLMMMIQIMIGKVIFL
jgi:hypothetical protein